VLLERELQLATLDEYVADARRGEGRLVLVSGEAGVGKSALVEELERRHLDLRWAWGACDGLFTPRPLGPLLDLATALGGALRDPLAIPLRIALPHVRARFVRINAPFFGAAAITLYAP